MLTHYIDIEDKNLQESIIALMLNAQVNLEFDGKVSDIIRDRQMALNGVHHKDWDQGEVLRIKEFNKNIEIGVTVYETLKRLYKKGFSNFDALEDTLKESAKEAANYALIKYGWIKESEVK